MRLVMVGTGPFGVPTFRRLLESRHAVLWLVTAPTVRDGRSVPPSPLREIAAAHRVPVFDPPDINEEEARRTIASWDADLLVVCDYGQILSAQTLAAARLGGVNLHASLLPKYRGAAPIQWAVYHGEKTTGVSVIHMTPQVDAGPVIAQSEVDILPDETAAELETRLADIGAWLMLRTIDNLEAGLLEALPQDPAAACKAPKLKKTDGLVDWRRSAEAIRNQVRAMVPWPKTYTYWLRPGKPPLRLILESVQTAARTDPAAAPGTVLDAGPRGILVAAGEDAVLVRALQPAGKRVMSAEDFLRGYRLQPGDRWGTPQGAE
ncbi:methionyl-tRNA formyltransferase [Thermopirellula anaerolimosa]